MAIYSENLIRSGLMDETKQIRQLRELRPDAVVKINVKNKEYLFPLEYEASSKSEKRNAKRISQYYCDPFFSGVIFISKNQRIESRMRQKELSRKDNSKGKFYYCLLENILELKDKLPLTNIKDGTLVLE